MFLPSLRPTSQRAASTTPSRECRKGQFTPTGHILPTTPTAGADADQWRGKQPCTARHLGCAAHLHTAGTTNSFADGLFASKEVKRSSIRTCPLFLVSRYTANVGSATATAMTYASSAAAPPHRLTFSERNVPVPRYVAFDSHSHALGIGSPSGFFCAFCHIVTNSFDVESLFHVTAVEIGLSPAVRNENNRRSAIRALKSWTHIKDGSKPGRWPVGDRHFNVRRERQRLVGSAPHDAVPSACAAPHTRHRPVSRTTPRARPGPIRRAAHTPDRTAPPECPQGPGHNSPEVGPGQQISGRSPTQPRHPQVRPLHPRRLKERPNAIDGHQSPDHRPRRPRRIRGLCGRALDPHDRRSLRSDSIAAMTAGGPVRGPRPPHRDAALHIRRSGARPTTSLYETRPVRPPFADGAAIWDAHQPSVRDPNRSLIARWRVPRPPKTHNRQRFAIDSDGSSDFHEIRGPALLPLRLKRHPFYDHVRHRLIIFTFSSKQSPRRVLDPFADSMSTIDLKPIASAELVDGICSFRVSFDETRILVGLKDGSVALLDAKTLRILCSAKDHSSWVCAVAFSADGKCVATAATNDPKIVLRSVSLADPPTAVLSGHSGGVWDLDFSPDGRLLCSASGDFTVGIWDLASNQLLRKLSGHSSCVNCVRFARDGKRLFSGSDDKTIKEWDVDSGKCVATMTGHTYWVWRLVLSSSADVLLSCSHDKTARLWDLK